MVSSYFTRAHKLKNKARLNFIMEAKIDGWMRSSSCRGVTFESSRAPPAAPPRAEQDSGRWVWIPWAQRNSFRVRPSEAQVRRSMSRSSSHFCDMDGDVDDEDDQDEEKVVEVLMDDVEKQKPVVSVAKKPMKSRLSVILLDQGLLTVYKRLFVVCFSLNIVMLVLAILNKFPYAKRRPALFCMGNILALTLCRSEAFLRIIFWLAVKTLGRNHVPLAVKTAATSFLQSLGGIHSSCGISSVAWLTYALVLTLNDRSSSNPTEIPAVAFTILTLLCSSCIAAFPLVRHLHHNVFERTHRFAGWTALALLWVFIILKFGYDNLLKEQEFWLTVAITFFTVLPWTTVRCVQVTVSAPSNHASIIKFPGGIKPGILGRISRSPLSEWHAFGIISDGENGHMMLAGAVGDFTRGLIADPPTHLWVRTMRFAGLPYLVNMYERAVLVATGSGICVFLSFLLQRGAADVCLVWVTKGVEQNFGREIKEMVSGYAKDKVIVHDTAVLGRPNVAQMTIEAARNWKAEVVVVTSNPEGSRDVVEACRAEGIPAFGPIWDS